MARRRWVILWLGLLCATFWPGAFTGRHPHRTAQAQAECGRAAVTSPLAGETLSGVVDVLGSAEIDRFMFYKVEWATGQEPETWRAVSEVIRQPVRNGRLDVWDTSPVPGGAVRLKLTLVDVDSQERCRVIVEPLRVAGSPVGARTSVPTPTALPTMDPDAPTATMAPTAGVRAAATALDTPTPAGSPTAGPTIPPALPRRELEGGGVGGDGWTGPFVIGLLLALGIGTGLAWLLTTRR